MHKICDCILLNAFAAKTKPCLGITSKFQISRSETWSDCKHHSHHLLNRLNLNILTNLLKLLPYLINYLLGWNNFFLNITKCFLFFFFLIILNIRLTPFFHNYDYKVQYAESSIVQILLTHLTINSINDDYYELNPDY